MTQLELRGEGCVDRLLSPGAGARLGVARTSGAVSGEARGALAWIVVEDGRGRLGVSSEPGAGSGAERVEVDGRDSVFERAGWSAVVGPGGRFELEGGLRATVVWRASARPTPSRIIDPATVCEEQRGEGATARRVRTYVPEGELIVGETLNPPGGWSSYPPHRHEHEEVYLYRFDPPGGFGVHVSYDDATDSARMVRDGSIERITTGYHPVVAAPASAMYYLWALAGDRDTVDTYVDPRFA
jgi:5-deoxy-D-glucuronate isomerase